MRTKDRVRAYRADNPAASVREIQDALGISSPSVVQYHLNTDTEVDRVVALLLLCRTPFASTLTHEQALERLREINRITYKR